MPRPAAVEAHHLRPSAPADLARPWGTVRGEILAAARRRAELTQESLAERLGITPRHVRRAEAGFGVADDIVTSWLRICS